MTKIWGGGCGIKGGGGGGEERQHRRGGKLLFLSQWLNPNHWQKPFQWGGQLICDTGTNGLNQRNNPTGTSNSSCDIQHIQCFQQLMTGFTLLILFFLLCEHEN